MHILQRFWHKGLLSAVLFVCCILSFQDALGQRVALKTNALEYFTLSPNLTLEARLSRKLSFQMGIAANPFNATIANYKLANFRVEPELRYWFNRPMAKHFIALSGTAGAYSLQLKERHLKGDVIALGISYGYALVLGRHWNAEFEVGAGIGNFTGMDYKDPDKMPSHRNMNNWLPVPVRASISIGYIFK